MENNIISIRRQQIHDVKLSGKTLDVCSLLSKTSLQNSKYDGAGVNEKILTRPCIG